MTRTRKLYLWVLDNPRAAIPFRDFERLLKVFGFVEERQRGSHRAYSHPRCDRLMIVQPRGKDAKPYQVQQFLDIIEEFGLMLEE